MQASKPASGSAITSVYLKSDAWDESIRPLSNWREHFVMALRASGFASAFSQEEATVKKDSTLLSARAPFIFIMCQL